MGNKEGGGGTDLKKGAAAKFLKKLSFSDTENSNLNGYYNKFINEIKCLNTDKLLSTLFLSLNDKVKLTIVSFLNSYYQYQKEQRVIPSLDQLNLMDFITLSHILLKANSDTEDTLYFKKNIILILYDIIKGKIESYEENKSNLSMDDLLPIFNFVLSIYFNKYAKKSKKHQEANGDLFSEEFKEEYKEFLIANIIPSESEDKTITLNLLEDFIDNKVFAIDGFIKNYFKVHLYNQEDSPQSVSLNPFPLFNDPPSTIPTYQFFYFCLSNSNISSNLYAFKLYDCKTQGYNLQNLIYSFLGFTGPIAIFVQNYTEKTNKLMCLGMFINSNFKECYENFCGDSSSFIFTIDPKMNFYKQNGSDSEHICFISSKSQKFSKSIPGIGMGYRNGEIRFWLDANSLFSKSYFNKYDSVFDDGTPFEELKQKLDIGNVEVFGFGDEDALEALIKKQERDKVVIDKMKKVDKNAFASNDFDKEMFFGKTFEHRGQVDERGAEDLAKKDSKEEK